MNLSEVMADFAATGRITGIGCGKSLGAGVAAIEAPEDLGRISKRAFPPAGWRIGCGGVR